MMTDNEINKALECCCGDDGCFGCPYTENNSCRLLRNPIKDALDLINSQKAEIERLTHNIEAMAQTMPNMVKAERAEAVKEFAEMVKGEAYRTEFGTPVVDVEDIDNLLKQRGG